MKIELNRYPESFWKEPRLFSAKELCASLAGEAVRISPYDCPDSLGDALTDLARVLPLHFKAEFSTFYKMTWTELQVFLDMWLSVNPHTKAWNERKNGREGMGFASRFSGRPAPDDDFIDLVALRQNMICKLMVMHKRDDDFNADFNRRHGKLEGS